MATWISSDTRTSNHRGFNCSNWWWRWRWWRQESNTSFIHLDVCTALIKRRVKSQPQTSLFTLRALLSGVGSRLRRRWWRWMTERRRTCSSTRPRWRSWSVSSTVTANCASSWTPRAKSARRISNSSPGDCVKVSLMFSFHGYANLAHRFHFIARQRPIPAERDISFYQSVSPLCLNEWTYRHTFRHSGTGISLVFSPIAVTDSSGNP